MTTTTEFNEIEHKYLAEQKRWSDLTIGQFVLIEFGRFFDIEYYLCIIKSVDINDRRLHVLDLSRNIESGGKLTTISSFRTISELESRGIKIEITEKELELSKKIKEQYNNN